MSNEGITHQMKNLLIYDTDRAIARFSERTRTMNGNPERIASAECALRCFFGDVEQAGTAEVINREQWNADQKSIGAMELALERICDMKWTRQETIAEARKALELVRKFREEAKQQ